MRPVGVCCAVKSKRVTMGGAAIGGAQVLTKQSGK